MCTCVYDNPDTMQRECWQDGRLVRGIDAVLLLEPRAIPDGRLFFGANIGPWNKGQMVGDAAAMTPEVKAL